MSAADVYLLPTGTANLASVAAALRRCGRRPRLVEHPSQVEEAERLVLPGVGTFGAAMADLESRRLIGPLRERVRSGRATLAVCLGLQLLARGSEESPAVDGLGVLPATVRRLPPGPRVPQMGWNRVEPDEPSWLGPGWAYFAHSFALREAADGWRPAWTEHGGRFVSALARGRVLACQFHPELSGSWGEALIRRWLEGEGA
jgi:imidazole glycerol phosphate synthase glutamine amidotransferase subunit